MLHICFGYGRLVENKPARYDFLAELDACAVDELSIDATQPRLDPSVLDELPTKRIQFGVLDLRDTSVESVDLVAGRIRAALDHVPPERLVFAPDCGCKYLSRDAAWAKAWRPGLCQLRRAARAQCCGDDGDARPTMETGWEDQYFRTSPRFETGAERYEWLQRSLFVARGRFATDGVEYEVFRVE